MRLGGGSLESEAKGECDIVCPDGSSMVLSDVLYVPNLGCSLVSVRKLNLLGLEGGFDSNNMFYFRKDDPNRRKLVTASWKNGLYIISHVSKKFAKQQRRALGNKAPTEPVQESSKVQKTSKAFPSYEVVTDKKEVEASFEKCGEWTPVTRKNSTSTLSSFTQISTGNRYAVLEHAFPSQDDEIIEPKTVEVQPRRSLRIRNRPAPVTLTGKVFKRKVLKKKPKLTCQKPPIIKTVKPALPLPEPEAYCNHHDVPSTGSDAIEALWEDDSEMRKRPPPANTDFEKHMTTRGRYELFHRRFGHLGPKLIANLHKCTTLKTAIRIPSKARRGVCEVCALTKMTNRISTELAAHKSEALARIQFDTAGPFPRSLRGNQYFILIVDSYTRRNWTLCVANKSDAGPKLREWKLKVELEQNKKVKAARTDNAPELLKEIASWETTTGVQGEPTVIASSHQNGPAERNIRTAEADMRAMLKEAGLPMEFWDEAIEADTYVRNRTAVGPLRDPKDEKSRMSPEEAWTGIKPSIDHIVVWGSKCYSHILKKTIPTRPGFRHGKWIDTGRIGIFMGYSETTTKQYKVYNPELGYTSRTSRVIVDEWVKGGTVDLRFRNCAAGPNGTLDTTVQGTPTVNPDRKARGRPKKATEPSPASPQTGDMSAALAEKAVDVAETNVFGGVSDNIAEPGIVDAPPPAPSTAPSTMRSRQKERRIAKRERILSEATPNKRFKATVEDIPEVLEAQPTAAPDAPEISLPPTTEQPDFFTRKRPRSDSMDQNADSERLHKTIRALVARVKRGEAIDDVLEEAAGLGVFEHAFPAKVVNGIRIPLTYEAAIRDPLHAKDWKLAIIEEITSLLSNETWKEVIQPNDANLVSTKWVFDVKVTDKGTTDRFKARLVARGFSQVQGQDFQETFAPTVRMDTLRLFLATVAKEDLECRHYDIKNAFTEAHLREQIYLSPPKGVDVKPGYCLQALRSLYGLKQAARDWNSLMREKLIEWGFAQSLADPCLFTHEKRKIVLLVYVDDIVASAPQTSDLHWFYKTLLTRFKAKDLKEISKILGARVTRDRASRSIYIDQEHYINAVLDKFGITTAQHKSKQVPACDYKNFRPSADSDRRINVSEYQQAVGSLMYAMIFTRPDIAFTLGKLSQYMSDPSAHHGHAMKDLMRYLKSTASQKLRYGPGGVHTNFVVYSDADWASDKTDRKSVSGSIVMFYGGPISWSSKKQKSVATSTCESEYMALSTCTKQGQWVAQIFRDIGRPQYIGTNSRSVTMLGDNQGALALVKNPHLHERSKHIDICYHYVRDLQSKGQLTVEYIPTADMVADAMTKPLDRIKFGRFKQQIGVVER